MSLDEVYKDLASSFAFLRKGKQNTRFAMPKVKGKQTPWIKIGARVVPADFKSTNPKIKEQYKVNNLIRGTIVREKKRIIFLTDAGGKAQLDLILKTAAVRLVEASREAAKSQDKDVRKGVSAIKNLASLLRTSLAFVEEEYREGLISEQDIAAAQESDAELTQDEAELLAELQPLSANSIKLIYEMDEQEVTAVMNQASAMLKILDSPNIPVTGTAIEHSGLADGLSAEGIDLLRDQIVEKYYGETTTAMKSTVGAVADSATIDLMVQQGIQQLLQYLQRIKALEGEYAEILQSLLDYRSNFEERAAKLSEGEFLSEETIQDAYDFIEEQNATVLGVIDQITDYKGKSYTILQTLTT